MKKLTRILVLFAVTVFFCSSFTPRHQPFNVAAGTYELLQVTGDNLAEPGDEAFTGGILISTDGTWIMLVDKKQDIRQGRCEVYCGTYELKDNRLEFSKDTDGDTYSGKMTGDRLLLNTGPAEKDVKYVFCRCNTAL